MLKISREMECDFLISKAVDLRLYLSSVGNKRDHTSVMDLLTSLYSDFVMDDREVLFHSVAGHASS